jgi:hypothetical protein
MKILELKELREVHQKRLQEQRDQKRIDEIMQELRQRVKEHDRLSHKQDH